MNRPRVVLVEDHRAVAEQLQTVLAPAFEIVATVTDGYGMIGAWTVLKPDVLVADITMPGMDGITAAQWILQADATAKIVFVTVHREPELMHRAMEIGAMGYVLKSTADEDLVSAVEAALKSKRRTSNVFGPPGQA